MLQKFKNRLLKFKDNPKAIFTFFLKKVYYNFIADSLLKEYKDFKYLTPQETLNKIISEEKSLIRFGDGSFDIIMGFSIYFNGWRQKYDPTLAKRLQEIMRSKNEHILISYPADFILKPRKWFKERGEEISWYSWIFAKLLLRKFYNKDMIYGNSLCFYPKYNNNIDYQRLKTFFLKKNIVIITSNISFFSELNLGKKNFLIECPSSDAWQSYEELKQKLLSFLEKNALQKEDTLILISMAEAAKVLVYDLSLIGYKAWDTGQFFDMASKEIKKISSTSLL